MGQMNTVAKSNKKRTALEHSLGLPTSMGAREATTTIATSTMDERQEGAGCLFVLRECLYMSHREAPMVPPIFQCISMSEGGKKIGTFIQLNGHTLAPEAHVTTTAENVLWLGLPIEADVVICNRPPKLRRNHPFVTASLTGEPPFGQWVHLLERGILYACRLEGEDAHPKSTHKIVQVQVHVRDERTHHGRNG